MPLLQVVVLAVVQGVTEFLPVSSTAHLYLTSWLLGWQTEALSFDIMLHVGTLAAVLAYFFKDWIAIIGHGFGIRGVGDPAKKYNPKLLWLLAIGTVPVVIAGLLVKDLAETTWRNPVLMGCMLIAVGIVMWIGDRVGSRRRQLGSVSLADALIIGVAQILALIPGCSRSGITVTAGLFRDFDREAAARFSFLLSTPAIGGAAAKAVWDIYKTGAVGELLTAQFVVGVAVSGLVGCAVIAWFLHYLRRNSLNSFVYYRIIFGIIVLALAFIRRPA